MTEARSETGKVGIIGTGAVSQIVHLPILCEREDIEVVAVSDADGPKAETIARRFGIDRVVADDELLADPEIEAVVVGTPNHLHEEFAVRVLEAGKHVLVERPLALSRAGVQRVLDAAEKADRRVMAGMNHRFRPDVGALRSFVSGGELGEVYAVRASSLVKYVAQGRSKWRRAPGEQGGGALMDLGVPVLDLGLWLVGYPKIERVSCVLKRDEGGTDTAATVMMVSDDGIAFTIEVSWELFADTDRNYARVMGREGSGKLPPLEISKVFGGRPMDVTPRQPKTAGGENRFTNAYRRLIDQWVRAITGRFDLALPVEQLQLMSVLEAAYRSAEEGAEVRLDS